MSEESHGEDGGRNIRVHLANTSFNTVRFNDQTDVKKVISVVVNRFAGTDLDIGHYAIRLLHLPHGPNAPPSDIFWLHRDLSMQEVQSRFQTLHSPHQWRYELRVRYLSKNLEEMYRTQRATFFYFYDQVRSDYLDQVAWKIDQETALQLGSLEIRRFCKDMLASALEKKSNLDFLEAEIGFRRFFPDDLIVSLKPKQLRKSIQQNFKKFAPFTESECMFRFLELLSKIARFDIEIFKCSLGTNWSVPVEVVVGPEMGISYVTDKRSTPVSLADFIHVVDIQTQCPQGPTGKALVSFRVSGATEPLNVTCPSLPIAESLADLVDGYHTLMTQNQNTVWSKREYFSESILPDGTAPKSPKLTRRVSRIKTEEEDDLDPDYSAPLERGYELDRRDITLEELLGNGQFGDVYRGRLEGNDGATTSVAVKACKIESEESHGDSFLEEAYIMQQFDHPHIISLIGVCLDSPIWIVMEMAEFGELRSYLKKFKESLETKTLLSFCHQLSMALSYLESKRFVHRDIAARNVLVASRDKVKLSDFGLSRWIEGESFYTASRGKLPIKWMAPESINFRRFTHASDVWMFGVCMWEIMMKGVKPFQGVRNQEVAQKLERGERLEFPPQCPPKLFNLLTQTWAFDYTERPTMKEVREQLHQIQYETTHSAADSVAENFRRMKTISWDLNGPESQPPPKPCRDTESLERKKGSRDEELPSQTGTWPRRQSQDNGCNGEGRKESKTILKAALEQQRIESEEDNKWLEREEQNMLPLTPTREGPFSQSFSQTQDTVSPTPSNQEEKMKIAVPDNMEIEREGDEVYRQVLAVVRPITDFSKTVHDMQPESFVEVVKKIGMEVRTLLGIADEILPQLNSSHQTQVKLSEKLLSADMQKFAESMKRSILYSSTTLDTEYRKGMLADGHVLAMDCKQFLETLDSARLASNILSLRPRPSSAGSTSNGNHSPTEE